MAYELTGSPRGCPLQDDWDKQSLSQPSLSLIESDQFCRGALYVARNPRRYYPNENSLYYTSSVALAPPIEYQHGDWKVASGPNSHFIPSRTWSSGIVCFWQITAADSSGPDLLLHCRDCRRRRLFAMVDDVGIVWSPREHPNSPTCSPLILALEGSISEEDGIHYHGRDALAIHFWYYGCYNLFFPSAEDCP